MSAVNVFRFPVPATSLAPPPIAPAVARRRDSEVDVPELQAMLALTHLSPRTLIEHLRVLHAKSGLPTPKNPRIVKGEEIRGIRAIHAGSVWHRVAIEQWLDDREPPAVRAALARERRSRIRAELAARAHEIAA